MSNIQSRHRFYQEYGWLAYHQRTPWLNKRIYRIVKRCFDVFVVLAASPLAIAIIILCCLIIKIESPDSDMIFVQKRTGKGGHQFDMFKFRTMVMNAEEMKRDLMHLNERIWPDFKITTDPRVTHIGRFLRRSSLDELPQLLNILRGEMSLVGPRPTSFNADTYALWQTERLDVLPGLTGMWQVMGRGSMEFDERVNLDMIYIENRSFILDLEILARTFMAVLRQKGAH